MKTQTYSLACLALFLGLFFQTGCGKNDENQNNTNCPAGYTFNSQYNQCVTNAASPQLGNCGAGAVYTQYGCLPQAACPSGSAMHPQMGCVPAGTGFGNCPPGLNTTQAGCSQFQFQYQFGVGNQYGYGPCGYNMHWNAYNQCVPN